jgi:hypothetical protein
MDHFSRFKAKRVAARHELFDHLPEMLRQGSAWDLSDKLKGVGKPQSAPETITAALIATKELLNSFHFPMAPQVQYTGMRVLKSAANEKHSTVEEGMLMFTASFRTLSGVRNQIEIPVMVKEGQVIQPSVFIHEGTIRVIAPSSIDEMVRRGTFTQTVPERSIYTPPPKGTPTSSEVRRTRMNPGMFSMSGARNLLKAAVAGEGEFKRVANDLPGVAEKFVLFVLPSMDQDDPDFDIESAIQDYADGEGVDAEQLAAEIEKKDPSLFRSASRIAQSDELEQIGLSSGVDDIFDLLKQVRDADPGEYVQDSWGYEELDTANTLKEKGFLTQDSQAYFKLTDKGKAALNRTAAADEKEGDEDGEERHNLPPAKGDMVYNVGALETIGDRAYVDISWDPEVAEGFSNNGLRQSVLEFVKQRSTHKDHSDWGMIADPQIEEIDVDAGEAIVSFKSSEISAPQLAPAKLEARKSAQKKTAHPWGDDLSNVPEDALQQSLSGMQQALKSAKDEASQTAISRQIGEVQQELQKRGITARRVADYADGPYYVDYSKDDNKWKIYHKTETTPDEKQKGICFADADTMSAAEEKADKMNRNASLPPWRRQAAQREAKEDANRQRYSSKRS